MKYHYNTGNNQLNYVYDTVPAGNYSVDIDAQSANNYQYDAIGNLIKDNAEGISSINLNVYCIISSNIYLSFKGVLILYINRFNLEINSLLGFCKL